MVEQRRAEDRSAISVSWAAGRSRLTSCRSVAPLKILNPRTHARYCAAILSSYGGGLVAGDRVDLRIDCGPGAGLFLGSQAFTRIYRTIGGVGSSQLINGTIGAGGCVVVLPDPVVPYAQSAFRQEQAWDLQDDALLVIVDWFTAGRLERGERFQYSSYASDVTESLRGRPVLADRLLAQPATSAVERVGAFGDGTVSLNLFVVGSPADARFRFVTAFLATELEPLVRTRLHSSQSDDACPVLVSYGHARPEVFVARAMGRTTGPVQDLVQLVGDVVATPEILGENPLRRKY